MTPLRPPLEVFCRPLPLFAVALLAVNDHLLKGAGWLPGWLTGKLSDLAGMFYFPLFLAALLGGTRPPAPGRPLALHLGCALAVGLGFTAIKGSEAGSALYEQALGLVRQGPIHNVADPTDLVALGCCFLAVLYTARVQRLPRTGAET